MRNTTVIMGFLSLLSGLISGMVIYFMHKRRKTSFDYLIFVYWIVFVTVLVGLGAYVSVQFGQMIGFVN